MTGFEAAAAAAGGRLLGALAAPAAQALARKMSFRWLVWWRVRKRVDFSCPWRTYRKWLKTISAEELAKPVEDIQGPLANRLDVMLSAKSEAWALSSGHLSRSLRLVELTYPAIAAALADGDRAALSESWAHQRSVNVRDVLLQLAGHGAALSSSDLAMVLRKRSKARRQVRLQAFEIDEAALASYFARIEIPRIPEVGVAVLLGDFGSGKSETAETWHRAGIDKLAEAEDAPFPVWLSARDLLGQTLESAVERQLGHTWRQGRGAAIVVDGLDETEPATAQTLLDAARMLTRTFNNVQVLLTARPGILTPTATEEVTSALLTEDRALELVESVSGRPHSTWGWTADMRATVMRPFFALGAGLMLSEDRAPHGEADLIRELVENALEKGTERPAVTSEVTRSVLEKLAVALTRTGGDGLSFSERQIARSSRLVADGRADSVRFSLPIFQHWFAAQAILAGTVEPGEVVADALRFNRWRWAAAVAALSASAPHAVDELLSTWVAGNPGAAAWIINEAFKETHEWHTEEDEDLEAPTSGARLLRSLRTWTESLGDLADGTLPAPMVAGPVRMGVTTSGRWMNVAFSTSQPTADLVMELPSWEEALAPTPDPAWLPWLIFGVSSKDAWPWIMVQNHIENAMGKKLSSDPLLGSPDGIWVQERRFDLARHLLGRGSLYFGSLPADKVRDKAVERFAGIGHNRDAKTSFSGSGQFSGAELDDLAVWIDSTSSVELVSHLPERDVSSPGGGWVWDRYSPQRLMEFEVEVYGRACEAFDEALAHSFARLGWSLPTTAFAPFGVLLELKYDPSNTPVLNVIRVPMALLSQSAPTGRAVVWSSTGRAVISQANPGESELWSRFPAIQEAVHRWLTEQRRESVRGLGWVSTGANDMSKVRPASNLAAGWLWDDLRSLGLASGGTPRLR